MKDYRMPYPMVEGYEILEAQLVTFDNGTRGWMPQIVVPRISGDALSVIQVAQLLEDSEGVDCCEQFALESGLIDVAEILPASAGDNVMYSFAVSSLRSLHKVEAANTKRYRTPIMGNTIKELLLDPFMQSEGWKQIVILKQVDSILQASNETSEETLCTAVAVEQLLYRLDPEEVEDLMMSVEEIEDEPGYDRLERAALEKVGLML